MVVTKSFTSPASVVLLWQIAPTFPWGQQKRLIQTKPLYLWAYFGTLFSCQRYESINRDAKDSDSSIQVTGNSTCNSICEHQAANVLALRRKLPYWQQVTCANWSPTLGYGKWQPSQDLAWESLPLIHLQACRAFLTYCNVHGTGGFWDSKNMKKNNGTHYWAQFWLVWGLLLLVNGTNDVTGQKLPSFIRVLLWKCMISEAIHVNLQ